jgi:AcrR family transcriptional regulator
MYCVDTPYGSGDLTVWERPEPRPRAAPTPLSRAALTTAAIQLADAHGLDAVSIRKIATELGVGPMRFYDYVAGKHELLDLMVDAVYAEIAAAAAAAPPADWRAAVLAFAHATRDAALEHEWFTDLLGGRPRLGPHTLAVGEATAAALSLAPQVRDTDDLQRTLGVLNAYLIGTLRSEVTERRTARATATDERAWQRAHGPYLQRVFATGKYPTVARLVRDGSHLDAGDLFARNVAAIVDAIAG